MNETLKYLIAHAVEKYGKGRTYTITFKGDVPIVNVQEGDKQIAEIWTIGVDCEFSEFEF